jgi:O-antigen/teichoic acid export membrane protein
MQHPASEQKHAERFFINVLWNWLAVLVNLFISFYLTRYLIRRLTDEQYGVWVLAFSLIEYITLFDLGFRSAIVNFLSHFRVRNDEQGMSEVLSTALAYFLGIAALAVFLSMTLAPQGYKAFNISPVNRGDFSFLLMLVGFIWAGSIVSGIFQASLEAFQAFGVCNKIFVGIVLVRSLCCIGVLYLGYGLRPLGLCTFVAQFCGWIMIYIAFRRILPHLKISRSSVRAARWKEMAKYGLNSVFSNTGTLFLNQGPPLVVGHYLSATSAGYYGLPFRLLNYMVDLITRIGFVTAPKTAELWATGQREQIGRLGTRLNRYCFALFLPASIYLAIYGQPLLSKWLARPEFVAQCAPLLPIFAISVSFAVSAQFNSSSMLFGMAKHGPFAISVMIEAAVALVGMALVLPHYGIFGGACVAAGATIINRGLITPLIVCRALPYNYLHYMSSIYVRPLLCGIPVMLLALWLRSTWLPGHTIFQLMLAGGLLISIGLSFALVVCVEPEHRKMIWDMAMKKLGKGPAAVPLPTSELSNV